MVIYPGGLDAMAGLDGLLIYCVGGLDGLNTCW